MRGNNPHKEKYLKQATAFSRQKSVSKYIANSHQHKVYQNGIVHNNKLHQQPSLSNCIHISNISKSGFDKPIVETCEDMNLNLNLPRNSKILNHIATKDKKRLNKHVIHLLNSVIPIKDLTVSNR